jgi:phosphomannomutase
MNNFAHLDTIYRSFDIRGKFPEELTVEEVEKIGKAIVTHFKTKKIAVGRDIRPSADVLFKALSSGITSMGCDIIDLGLTTTPMTYFISGSTDVDATVMITASHMPSEYNGLKITIEDSKPVTADLLQILREIVGTHTFSSEETVGNISTHAMQAEWIAHFKAKHDLSGSKFKIVIDPANMVGALDIPTFKAFAPELEVHTIYEDLDHTCPNHEANPVKLETMTDLGNEVKCVHADLGIAFDGDADRVGFVDENGGAIPSDIIGMLLTKSILKKYPGSTIVYDIRSTKALPELITKLGGIPVREKVGHSFIKTTMRKHEATLGIELSGHFFFKESYYSEGGPLPAFLILELLKEEKKTLSELATEATKYFQSSEINSKISKTPDEIYATLIEKFSEADIDRTDGLTLTLPDWWCNVRPSANDPVMRLNLEANTSALMQEKRDEVLEVILSK